jgi:hypothetical protein
MAKYRRKPVIVDAVRYDGCWSTVRDWLDELTGPQDAPITRNEDGSLNIVTLEGAMRAEAGDYIIRGVAGEFYPCKPDIFDRVYEEVS